MAVAAGGGISFISGYQPLSLRATTITANRAKSTGFAIGGGVLANRAVLRNSIVAGNLVNAGRAYSVDLSPDIHSGSAPSMASTSAIH